MPLPTGHNDPSLTPLSGGVAPWRFGSPHTTEDATTQLSVLTWLCAILFTATLTVSIALTVFALRSYRQSVPPAPVFLSVFEDGAGGSLPAEAR